ncbi:Ribosomal silencing factor RsfS [Gracilariopsis chorda]|uniref:Ribosomal silencing factor RsfS n=1 Tax=Gracilariopsis chorda TaxID=448386 RepID=A0A2V3IR06_9FLOR|nr:Ribosomal silencing factor RsfS [Gracilariopsis chorda]|eukprot:PXF43590.1 Ribosomal silencing factor RsfS [Gracilariopsis chorda]
MALRAALLVSRFARVRTLCAQASQRTLSQINRQRAQLYLQRHSPHPQQPTHHPQQPKPQPITKQIPAVSGSVPSPPALKTLLENEHGAYDVVIIDVREKATFADSFLLCCAHTPAHIRAIAEQLAHFINSAQVTLDGHSVSICGHQHDEWLVVDIGHTVVHIMTEHARQQYRLEDLWIPDTPPSVEQ